MIKETADQETSSDYYHTRFSGKVGEWFLKIQGKTVLKAIEGIDIKSVLEVGGGHGQLLPYLLEKNLDVTVLGSDQICIHRIQNLVEQKKVNFVAGDLVNLPFPDNAFDAVISIRLLPHCSQWESLIAELTRVARKVVVVDYPPKESSNIFYSILFSFKQKHEGSTRPYTIFKNKQIRSEFRKNGFDLLNHLPQFFLPMVLYRKLNNIFTAKILEKIFAGLYLTKFFGSPVIASYIPKDLKQF